MVDINAIYEKNEFQFKLNKNSINIFSDLENKIKDLANLNNDCVLLFNLTNDLSSIDKNNINEIIEKYTNKIIKIFVRVKEQKSIDEEKKNANNFNFDDMNLIKNEKENSNDLNENNQIENNENLTNENKNDENNLDTDKLLEEVLKSTRESEFILNDFEKKNNNNNNFDDTEIFKINNSLDLNNNNIFPTPKPNLIQINNGNNFEVKEINENKKNIFSNEICSICNENLNSIKFICCICNNCILCEKCEKNHEHCVIKYKNDFLSDFFDSFLFMKRMNNLNVSVKKKIKGIFSQNSLDIKIYPKIDNEISLKINEKYSFPIIIDNQSKENINSKNSILIFKNNKNVNFFLIIIN